MITGNKHQATISQSVGRALKLIRTVKGIKQSDLADKMKFQKNYISMIENGRREPSLSFLQSAAAALDVEIDMFFVFAKDRNAFTQHTASNYDRLQEILLQFLEPGKIKRVK
jgi:transcriptional regulator with XRE-family HTH domain